MRSLKVQLIGAIAITLGLGLGALLLIAGSQMSAMRMESFIHEIQMSTLVVASNLPELMVDGGAPVGPDVAGALQQRLTNSSDRLDIGLTIVSPIGSVIATTHVDPLFAPQAPEVRSALDGYIAYDIRSERLYVAVPILHDGRRLIGVVWTDASTASVYASLQTRWFALIGATLITLGLACVIGWLLAVRIVRPLTAIQGVAEQMAKGQLSVRAEVSDSSLELASLGQSFNHMAHEIEAMMTRQREFVANASHELRSPLATIKLRAEALAVGSVTGDRATQYATEINDETTRLGRLVADLLHLSRIDSQSFVEPSEALNVADELMTSIRAIKPRANVRHQEIATDIQNDIPDVFIQSNDLRAMVDNLLDNAVKYTPDHGQISLSAHWEDTSLYVDVCDTGEGIPKEDLPRVTERFFRVDRAHTRGTPGTGLGLALVVATAQQYGGKLTLESNGTPGHGTRASLSLQPKYRARS